MSSKSCWKSVHLHQRPKGKVVFGGDYLGGTPRSTLLQQLTKVVLISYYNNVDYITLRLCPITHYPASESGNSCTDHSEMQKRR